VVVAFRADSGSAIGAGHLMRCLTLAEELRERGAVARFVSRAHPGHVTDLVRQRGFELAQLPGAAELGPDPGTWLGTSVQADAAATVAALADLGPVRWLVADHYAITAAWHRAARARVERIMVIDDVADRPLDADLILDQNFDAPARDYDVVSERPARTLLGPTYALIARAIRRAAERGLTAPPAAASAEPSAAASSEPSAAPSSEPSAAPSSTQAVARPRSEATVLVSLGGSDPDDATSDALRSAATALASVRRVDVVIGRAHPSPARVAHACAALGNATLHVQTDRMADLLAGADLALGAGGGSTWERLCVGVPSIVLPLAANQLPTLAALHEAGLVVGVDPDWRATGSLQDALERLLDTPGERARMSAAGRRLVDGRGATRVADAMHEGC
jgi:UDP-2,4-diacetamido-2,4,6-trideoxy-beta-L-altropyranose hydrolase